MRKNKSHQDNLPNYYLIVDLMNFRPSPRQTPRIKFFAKMGCSRLVPQTFSIYWCARFASAGWGLMFDRWLNCQDTNIV